MANPATRNPKMEGAKANASVVNERSKSKAPEAFGHDIMTYTSSTKNIMAVEIALKRLIGVAKDIL
jgi:hypothetical protein